MLSDAEDKLGLPVSEFEGGFWEVCDVTFVFETMEKTKKG